MKKRSGGAFIVNSKMCATCIFGANSPIPPERFEELKREWELKDIVQECHDSTINGGHLGCRGHYEQARNDETFNHPLDRVRDAMGMGQIDRQRFMRFCEEMEWVIFQDVEKTK